MWLVPQNCTTYRPRHHWTGRPEWYKTGRHSFSVWGIEKILTNLTAKSHCSHNNSSTKVKKDRGHPKGSIQLPQELLEEIHQEPWKHQEHLAGCTGDLAWPLLPNTFKDPTRKRGDGKSLSQFLIFCADIYPCAENGSKAFSSPPPNFTSFPTCTCVHACMHAHTRTNAINLNL